jgi:hypothetical protein
VPADSFAVTVQEAAADNRQRKVSRRSATTRRSEPPANRATGLGSGVRAPIARSTRGRRPMSLMAGSTNHSAPWVTAIEVG